MLPPMNWIVAAAVLLTAMPSLGGTTRIDVQCEFTGALERALIRAEALESVDIFIHGVCVGNYLIESDGIALRGASPESGLAAPSNSPGFLPVLEVDGAVASLRGLSVEGGEIGVMVHGPNGDLVLVDVDVHDQNSVGAFADGGARLFLIDTTIRNGRLGVLTDSGSSANLQRVTVSNQQVGITVFDRSFAALNDTTIENCREAGLSVRSRSDANVLGGVFRENSQVHISAVDWSSIRLLSEPTIGSATDTTSFAMGATRSSRIASYRAPTIYGDVSALDDASIRLGETVLHGDLLASHFANAHVRDAEITGSVFCSDGADVICRQTTTSGSSGCASSTCGPPTAETIGRSPSAAYAPVLNEFRFEPPARQ